MTMGKAIRMAAALGMALVLAACSSSNDGIKKDRDQALEDVMQLQTEISDAKTALEAAGATGDDLAALVASAVKIGTDAQGAIDSAKTALEAAGATGDDLAALVASAVKIGTDAQGAIGAAMTALENAGATGDDLAALVADVVQTLQDQKDAVDKATRAANVKEMGKVYGWLAGTLVSDTSATTDILQQAATVPDDAVKGGTQDPAKEELWVQTYNPSVNFVGSIDTGNERRDVLWAGDATKEIEGARITAGSFTIAGDGKGTAKGTFAGVAGTFKCASNCTLTFNDKGVVSAASEGWNFTPNDGSLAKRMVKDVDYTSFSYWLTMDADDEPTGFKVKYEGKGAYAAARTVFPTPQTPKKVNFSGSAGGKYVTRDITGYGSKGYFTADAALTATLSGDTTKVQGSISDFKDGDKAPLGDMSVKLKENTTNNTSGVFSGGTSSEADELGIGSGAWQATLYGGSNDGDTDPVAGAGAFNFSWGLGAVAGGFGVEVDKKE